jgi:hypothetical protein
LDGERWRTFFDAFQHTAFRLGTYPSYNVTSEREEYEGFLSSGTLSIPDDDSWLTRVRHFRATGHWIGQPNPGLPGQDFWLSDNTSAVRMDYDDQGVQLGRELVEGINPAPYAEWQRLALAHARPYAEYVKLLA